MAGKRSAGKGTKKAKDSSRPGRKVAKLEKALAAAQKAEAKRASRLEAARGEVAALRAALVALVGELEGSASPAVSTPPTGSSDAPASGRAPVARARRRRPAGPDAG